MNPLVAHRLDIGIEYTLPGSPVIMHQGLS